LGTRAIEDRILLKKAFKEFKERIIVSVDTKDGYVAIKGWQTSRKNINALTFAQQLKEMGFKQIIYTNISKDGTLRGPDIKGIKSLLKETGLKIIASGGVSSIEDIGRLTLLEKKGLTGVIIGKALYEGKFTLAQALKLA
jgi:phosphoribosylformimino-5-aminoimidazole carboxamide ribotide isomerase